MGLLGDIFGEPKEKPEYEKMLDAKHEGRLDEYMEGKHRKEKAELKELLVQKYPDDEEFVNSVLDAVGDDNGMFNWLKNCVNNSTDDKDYILRVARYYTDYSQQDLKEAKETIDNLVNSSSDRSENILKKVLVATFGVDADFIGEVLKASGKHDSYKILIEELVIRNPDNYEFSKGSVIEMAYMYLGDLFA